jgi:hypothetical protein
MMPLASHTAPSATVSGAIFTSIPPRLVRPQQGEDVGEAYQGMCVNSWLRAGLPVYSINTREEIAALRDRFPTVNLVEVPRALSSLRGAPTIGQIFQTMAKYGYDVNVLINGDVGFVQDFQIERLLVRGASQALVFSSRFEMDRLGVPAEVANLGGFDLFAIGQKLLRAYDDEELQLGLPWWDYWLPILMLVRGGQVQRLFRPAIAHLRHEAAWSDGIPIGYEIFMRQARRLVAETDQAGFEGRAARAAASLAAILDVSQSIGGDGPRMLWVAEQINRLLLSPNFVPTV